MKRLMLVALGGLLLLAGVSISAHAQEVPNGGFANRGNSDFRFGGNEFGSQFGRHGHRTCIQVQDIFEDLQQIQADRQALHLAIFSHNRNDIKQAREQLQSDRMDLRDDLQCKEGQVVSGSE